MSVMSALSRGLNVSLPLFSADTVVYVQWKPDFLMTSCHCSNTLTWPVVIIHTVIKFRLSPTMRILRQSAQLTWLKAVLCLKCGRRRIFCTANLRNARSTFDFRSMIEHCLCQLRKKCSFSFFN